MVRVEVEEFEKAINECSDRSKLFVTLMAINDQLSWWDGTDRVSKNSKGYIAEMKEQLEAKKRIVHGRIMELELLDP